MHFCKLILLPALGLTFTWFISDVNVGEFFFFFFFFFFSFWEKVKHFLSYLIKLKVPTPSGKVDLSWILAVLFRILSIFVLTLYLNCLAFQHFGHERIWWRLIQKSASYATKLVSIVLLVPLGRYHCWWTVSPRGYHPPSSQCFGIDHDS